MLLTRRSLCLVAIAVSVALNGAAHAQIATDGTLGAMTTLTGPIFAINATLGRRMGANLFHSFSTFNLTSSQSAIFSGPAEIANIISRVTGGSASSIDGLIRSTIGGANLFLINPKGILFGPNASLDLTGSFHASTADYLKLGSGGRFDASDPPASVLTSAPPEAFGFLGPSPAGITVQGSRLEVSPGKSLSLVAGNIALDGASLRTQGGDLRMVSLAGAGVVPLDMESRPAAGTSMGAITLDASELLADSSGTGALAPGRIVMRGGRLTVLNSVIASANTQAASAGTVELEASAEATIEASFISSTTAASGRGAAILLTADHLRVDGGQVSAGTESSGNAGSIELRGSDIVIDRGAWITTFAAAGSSGNAGDVAVAAVRSAAIQGFDADGFFSSVTSASEGSGSAGSIAIAAPVIVMDQGIAGTTTYAGGASGQVELSGDRIDLLNGSYIYADAESASSAHAGRVKIQASGAVTLRGSDYLGNASLITASSFGSGNAGTVEVRASEILLDEGARIDARAFSGGNAGHIALVGSNTAVIRGYDAAFNFSTLSASAEGAGMAGSVRVSSPTIVLDQGIIRAESSGAGDGGRIDLIGNQISLLNGSLVTAGARGSSGGGAGRIDVQASDLFELRGVDVFGTIGAVSSTTRNGNGGGVSIAAERVAIDGGGIFSEVSATGHGGSVDVRARSIEITGGGTISTNSLAGSSGDAGAVTLVAGEAIAVRGTVLADAHGSGAAGNVLFAAPRITIDDGRVGANTDVAGRGGRLELRGERIALLNGATLTSATFGSGDGGSIDVIATDLLELRGDGPTGFGSAILGMTQGTGRGADISIQADRVVMENGEIAARALAAGDAGSLVIRAGDIVVGGGGALATSSERASTGNGGSLSLHASRSVVVQGRNARGQSSEISSSTIGPGHAGEILVVAPSVTFDGGLAFSEASGSGNAGRMRFEVDRFEILNGGQISTVTQGDLPGIAAGRGGNIEVRAADSIVVSGIDSDSFVSSIRAQTRADASGGDIDLRARTIEVTDGGLVTSGTSSSGRAGNVALNATERITIAGGRVSADTLIAAGAGGSVRVAAPLLVISNGGAISSESALGSSGAAGNVDIVTGSLSIGGEGEPARISSSTTGSGAGGSINVSANGVDLLAGGRLGTSSGEGSGNAGNVSVVARELRIDGGQIDSSTRGLGGGGNVLVSAPDVRLVNDGTIEVGTSGSGGGGRLQIAAARVLIDSGARVVSATSGEGNAGSIVIRATENIAIGQEPGPDPSIGAGLRASTSGAGRGGDIVLEAPLVRVGLSGGITADTSGSGRGGDVRIGGQSVQLAGSVSASADSVGEAGSIEVSGGELRIERNGDRRGAVLSDAFEAGSAGNITIDLSGTLHNEGFISAATLAGPGRGGNITIRADSLQVEQGGSISASTFGSGAAGSIDIAATRALRIAGGEISATSDRGATGAAGNIRIESATMSLAHSDRPSLITSSTEGAGVGGNISIATGTLDIHAGGKITASSTGTGTAGAIGIAATDAMRLSGGVIATEASASDGGNIEIRVGHLVHLKNGEITTSVRGGEGSGGNIFIDPTFVILESSRIAANAFGGSGGSINIIANVFLASPDSVVEASSTLGLPGRVQILAPQIDVLSGLPALPAQFFDASALLRAACSGPGNANRSRLVGVGRGGIAALSMGYAPSRYFPDDGQMLTDREVLVLPAAPQAGALYRPSILLAGICSL